jgi:putative transposase
VALRRGIGETHRRYSRRINLREGWRGHLWQGRFASFPMDDKHLYLATRYVELNPVRARLVRAPWRWRWSSAAAHVEGRDDRLVRVGPLLERFGDWKEFLGAGLSEEELASVRRHERSGRPLGDEPFVTRLERMVGRVLHPGKPGPKGPWKEKRRRRRKIQ